MSDATIGSWRAWRRATPLSGLDCGQASISSDRRRRVRITVTLDSSAETDLMIEEGDSLTAVAAADRRAPRSDSPTASARSSTASRLTSGPSAGTRLVGYHRAMAALSRTDVEHVAHLARLGLTDAELTRLEGQLNHILDQYAILAELPTDDIPPTAQTIELENILREDVVRPSLPVEAVLANAPARDGDFIVVPAILDER